MERKKQHRDEVIIKEIGKRIRDIRNGKKMSQEDLANICELEISQINRIELGKINTSISHLYLIAEKLDISVKELLP